MKTYLRLERRVSDGRSSCALCSWESTPLDAVHDLVVGGARLATFCSVRCADIDARIRLRGPVESLYSEGR
jgi:hypothetical protein